MIDEELKQINRTIVEIIESVAAERGALEGSSPAPVPAEASQIKLMKGMKDQIDERHDQIDLDKSQKDQIDEFKGGGERAGASKGRGERAGASKACCTRRGLDAGSHARSGGEQSQKDQIDVFKQIDSDYLNFAKQYNENFDQAYRELRNGQRIGTWMWYICPVPEWHLIQVGTKLKRPGPIAKCWFIPDQTGIPFLLYHVNSNQKLIHRLYAMMRVAYDQLSEVRYWRDVFFHDFFGEDPAPILHDPIPGTTLFDGDAEWNIFQKCVEFFLKAIAAIMNRYEIPDVDSSIWLKDGQGKKLYKQEINKYHKAVQMAQPMEIYHEFFHLLQKLYTRFTHMSQP